MITILKLTTLSAILSAGLVAGFDGTATAPTAPGTAKPFQERLEAEAPPVSLHASSARPVLELNGAPKGRLEASTAASRTVGIRDERLGLSILVRADHAFVTASR